MLLIELFWHWKIRVELVSSCYYCATKRHFKINPLWMKGKCYFVSEAPDIGSVGDQNGAKLPWNLPLCIPRYHAINKAACLCSFFLCRLCGVWEFAILKLWQQMMRQEQFITWIWRFTKTLVLRCACCPWLMVFILLWNFKADYLHFAFLKAFWKRCHAWYYCNEWITFSDNNINNNYYNS